VRRCRYNDGLAAEPLIILLFLLWLAVVETLNGNIMEKRQLDDDLTWTWNELILSNIARM